MAIRIHARSNNNMTSGSNTKQTEHANQTTAKSLQDVKTYGDYKAYMKNLDDSNEKSKNPKSTATTTTTTTTTKKVPSSLRNVKTYGDYKAYLQTLDNKPQKRHASHPEEPIHPGRVMRSIFPYKRAALM